MLSRSHASTIAHVHLCVKGRLTCQNENFIICTKWIFDTWSSTKNCFKNSTKNVNIRYTLQNSCVFWPLQCTSTMYARWAEPNVTSQGERRYCFSAESNCCNRAAWGHQEKDLRSLKWILVSNLAFWALNIHLLPSKSPCNASDGHMTI